jgi:hypothetical protein
MKFSQKRRNVILIPPCTTFGDCLAVIGLLRFLLNYYEKVHFWLKERNDVMSYYHNFFLHDPLYGNRIFLVENAQEHLLSNSEFGEFDIVNTHTGDWKSAKFDLNNSKIENYFNDLNPLYNVLDVPQEFQTNPNCHLPNQHLEINHLFYNKLIGLNNLVRMNFFHYERNKDCEKMYSSAILQSYGLTSNDKYNIVNFPWKIQVDVDIGNSYPVINIDNAAPFPGHLLSLIEGAETISLVEGSNVNFLYHCQHAGIFNYAENIDFLVNRRNRNWPEYNLDYAWKMMDTPRLKNWNFLF